MMALFSLTSCGGDDEPKEKTTATATYSLAISQDLLDACKKDDYFMVQTSALVEAYITMDDLSKIESIMTDPELGGDDPEVMDKLVYDRNRDWVVKLVKMMPERACLVCVGAGHLPGDQGLLQLLRDRGYTVEPMK